MVHIIIFRVKRCWFMIKLSSFTVGVTVNVFRTSTLFKEKPSDNLDLLKLKLL